MILHRLKSSRLPLVLSRLNIFEGNKKSNPSYPENNEFNSISGAINRELFYRIFNLDRQLREATSLRIFYAGCCIIVRCVSSSCTRQKRRIVLPYKLQLYLMPLFVTAIICWTGEVRYLHLFVHICYLREINFICIFILENDTCTNVIK